MKHKTSMATFILIAVGSLVLPFINFNSGNKSEPQKEQLIEDSSSTTNSIIPTNGMDRTLNNKPAQNMDWFIQGSTYIWDDWKIK